MLAKCSIDGGDAFDIVRGDHIVGRVPPGALHLTSALRWIGLLGFAWLVGGFDMLWMPLSFLCFETH